MFIANTEEIREMDRLTIESGISAIDLMDKAADACYQWLVKRFDVSFPVLIFCGTGNNGGDGYALALKLLHSKYAVRIIEFDKQSESAQHFRELIAKQFDNVFFGFNSFLQSETFAPKTIVVDCLLGSGLKAEPNEQFQHCIQFINQSKQFVLSVDGPSGLNLDESAHHQKIVQADFSLIFQLPRIGLFFPENEKYVGSWEVLEIGLKPLLQYNSNTLWVEKSWVKTLKIPRSKFAHKGQMGRVGIVAGSAGKLGSAILSSEACIKNGAGLVTLFSDKSAELPLITRCPEIMFEALEKNQSLDSKTITSFDAWAVGPGIHQNQETESILKNLIQNANQLLIDADGLNLLAENKTWLSFIKPYSILTPHLKEFERLAGKSNSSSERIEMAKDFAFKYQIVIVLKGAYTQIITPEKKVYINSTGNPGMATAGSGDVLTGMILSLLGQHYSPVEAAILGVYLHGLAGDQALKFGESEESLTATSIVRHLGDAYQALAAN